MALREDLVSVSYLNNADSVVKMCQGKAVSLDGVLKQNVSSSTSKAPWALVGKVVKILDKSSQINYVWKLSLEVEDLLCKTTLANLKFRMDCYGDFALNLTLRNVSEGDRLIITSPRINRKQGSEKTPVVTIGLGYDPSWNIVICRQGSEPEIRSLSQTRRQPRDGRHHYTMLKNCHSLQDRYNIWAVVTKYQSSKRTKMGDFYVRLSVKDESLEMEVTVFFRESDNLPAINVGDIVRFSHLRVEKFNGAFAGVVNSGRAVVAFKGESDGGFDPDTCGCFEVSEFDKMLITKFREWKNFQSKLVEETDRGASWHLSNNEIIPFQSQPNFPNSDEFDKIAECFNTQAALDGMMELSNEAGSKVSNEQNPPEIKKRKSCFSCQEVNVERYEKARMNSDSQQLMKAKKKRQSRMSITTKTGYPIVSTEKELRQLKEFSKAKLWCNFVHLKVRDKDPVMMVCGICLRCNVTRNVSEPSYPQSEFLCTCGKVLKLGYRFQICVTDSLGVPIKLIYAGTSGKILGCSAKKFLHSKPTREKIIRKICQLKKRPALISILIAGNDISDDFKFHVVKSSFAIPKIISKQVTVTKI